MNDPISLASSLLALLGIWLVFDVGYRPYRVNVLRDLLFSLRSELFEQARTGAFGEQGFSNPVYLHARRMLNGYIRYAHQFTLFRLIVLHWSSRWWQDKERLRQSHAAFSQDIQALDPRAQAAIMKALRESEFAIVMHMIHVNVLGFVFVELSHAAVRLLQKQQQVRKEVAEKIEENRGLLEPLEQEALHGMDQIEQRMAA